MTQDQLLKLAQRYDDKASKAYYNYQETGMPRYNRERSNAEDLAEAMRIAAAAVEDHNKLINMRADLADLAYRAELAKDSGIGFNQVLAGIVSLAELYTGYKRRFVK